MTTVLDENMEDTKEKFDSILQKVSLKEYLKADPQQAGEKSELTHAMTYDFFLKNFCWTDENIDKLIEDYKYKIENENKKNVVLHGYEGCGKTTFINYWMNKEKNRHVVLEFDKYIRSGDELLATIVGNIFCELNKDVYENHAIIIRKICEIFTTEANLRCMAENDIKNNVETLVKRLNLRNEEEILNIDWSKRDNYLSINKLLNNNIEENIIIIVNGTKEYIKEANKNIDTIIEKNRDKINQKNIKIINCYEIVEFNGSIVEILDNHDKILNTSGEKEINEVFEDYTKSEKIS